MIKKNSINIRISIFFLLFSFIIFFFTTLNSPLYIYNWWNDPHIYYSIGKGIINGEVVYKDTFDHKGPLIFFIYAIGYLISNTNLVGIYILESLILWVNLVFVFKIANRQIIYKKQICFFGDSVISNILFA